MKRKLSAFLLLSLIVNNTYSTEKLNKNTAPKNNNVVNNRNIGSDRKKNQKNLPIIQKNNNSKKVQIGVVITSLAGIISGIHLLHKKYNSENEEKKIPDDHKDTDEHKTTGLGEKPNDDNEKDHGKKDDNNKQDSLPNFKEIFKNGLGPEKVNWENYRKHARLQWHNSCCWLLSFLNTVFNPSKKEIYFKYSDASLDEIMDYLDETKEKMKKYYSFGYYGSERNAEQIKELDVGSLFGKNQKELSDYLKANPNIDYNYIFENFIKNQKLYSYTYDDIEEESTMVKNGLSAIIFHFINLRKVYAIGFKARCQIFRAMINNPKEVISVHNDNNGIQINSLFDELMKLPKEVRYYDPEMNNNYAKECQIENMITGTLYKHNYGFFNYLDYKCCDIDDCDKNHGGSSFNKLYNLLDVFSAAEFCENELFADFNRGKNFDSNGRMKDSKSTYYAISSVAQTLGHDFCLLPKYKIDENGCIKYIGVVILSCTVTSRDDVFIPTKTGDFREIQEIAKWYNGYRQKSTSGAYVGAGKCHVISEEELRKNIQYYTVDDDIIKKFNL